ncbi:MFS transporter [Methylobacterium gnaphalii]|uniref:3-phenylpropionic acid transporter n=1 Tax=Methylobacterium gnaphalii TaxID=1010610 RepID=A0A512JJC0_9HYPH|nr:MFS transporter [Methylobacterium gnaphalii]GEP10049.1 3-phenylpropionic acid transporter [Methylobacterium gnaphalii]GJD67686.1 putative 3-phenylpropionic acid transporter [Methylobacterium gnaphalii]GLS48319.1 3-phenylpropionic acid transporter [Methylobacterium gnaphalii]
MTKAGASGAGTGLPGYLALFAALYGAYGALSPFLPAFLAERGLSPQDITVFLAAATLVRLASGPLAGRIADRTERTRGVLVISLALSAVANLSLLAGHGFWPLLAIGIVQAVWTAPLAPLADALALAAAQGGRAFQYGWARAAGSAAFISATVLSGFAVDLYGSTAGLGICGAAFAAAAVVATRVVTSSGPHASIEMPECGDGIAGEVDGLPSELRLSFETRQNLAPQDEGAHGKSSQRNGFLALAAIPRFRRVVFVAALVIGAHAMQDAFAVIVWRDAGLSSGIAGLLWSESVAAEVLVFLLIGPWLFAKLGAPGVLTIAALAGALRWAVQGATTWLPALVAIQSLHGLTFAGLHLACLAVIEQSVPDNLRATALSVYGTLGIGLASALLTLASGQLFGAVGLRAFWVMSALSLAAVPLALSLRAEK